jgi:hypothetical protein
MFVVAHLRPTCLQNALLVEPGPRNGAVFMDAAYLFSPFDIPDNH